MILIMYFDNLERIIPSVSFPLFTAVAPHVERFVSETLAKQRSRGGHSFCTTKTRLRSPSNQIKIKRKERRNF